MLRHVWPRPSRRELSKVFVPDPADLIRMVVLVLGQPELALFADDVEDLHSHQPPSPRSRHLPASRNARQERKGENEPRQRHKSGTGSPPRGGRGRY